MARSRHTLTTRSRRLTALGALAALAVLIPPFTNAQQLALSSRVYVGNNQYDFPKLPSGSTDKGGLHLPRSGTRGFNVSLTDGGGYNWTLQQYGNVYGGTDHAYSNALYSQINGSNMSAQRQCWMGPDGDEIEIYDRYSHKRYNNRYRKGLQCFRRVKVYKDKPLARWMDIFTNETKQDITITVTVYSSFPASFKKLTTASGKEFGRTARAFVSSTSYSNAPSVMHIYADSESTLKPDIQKGSNTLHVKYKLTIPAGKTRILCYFQAQGRSHDKLVEQMRTFHPWMGIRDLSPSVRKMIVNLGRTSGYPDFDLLRSPRSDVVAIRNGDVIFGDVANEIFRIETRFGDLNLNPDGIIGMQLKAANIAEDRKAATGRVLLVGGHILRGTFRDQVLKLKLEGGSQLAIPLSHIGEWSYKASEDKPQHIESVGPQMVLTDGQRLPIDPRRVILPFTSHQGSGKACAADLLRANFRETDDDSRDELQLQFALNPGQIMPVKISHASIPSLLPMDDANGVPLELVESIEVRSTPPTTTSPVDKVRMKTPDDNEDIHLVGLLPRQQLRLGFDNPDKPQTLDTANVRTLDINSTTDEGKAGIAWMTWSGEKDKAPLAQDTIAFRLGSRSRIDLVATRMEHLKRATARTPDEAEKQLDELVAQLGSGTVQQREKASEKLKAMDKKVLPYLRKKYAASRDPEIRSRIEDAIESHGETLSGDSTTGELGKHKRHSFSESNWDTPNVHEQFIWIEQVQLKAD